MVEIKAEIGGPGAEALKELAGGARGALRRAFGDALSTFGDMLDDRMKLWRFENLLKIQRRVDQIVQERNVAPELLKSLPFGDSMRVLEAASQEDEEAIQDLWARLVLKASIGPNAHHVSKIHIELIRSLTPPDRALLELLYPSVVGKLFASAEEVRSYSDSLNQRANSSWRLFDGEERSVSVQNLTRLRCITATPRLLRADGMLREFYDRERRISGALVDARKFEALLKDLLGLIYQTSGAMPYDTESPIPLSDSAGVELRSFGQIEVPELNHMLTPLGIKLMEAVTLEGD
jgi:hypothetical protein